MRNTPRRRTAAERRSQILKVATRLFARQGFAATTTKQIARRAKVNEAIIFRHFPRKRDLYWAVMDARRRSSHAVEKLQLRLRSGMPDDKLFPIIASDLLSGNALDNTLLRLVLRNGLQQGPAFRRLAGRFFKTHMSQYYETLAEHIRSRIRTGAYRRVDPVLAARAFVSLVVYHFLVQEFLGGKYQKKFDRRKISKTLTDLWLGGVLAQGDRRTHAASPSRRVQTAELIAHT